MISAFFVYQEFAAVGVKALRLHAKHLTFIRMRKAIFWKHACIWAGLYILWIVLFQNRTLTFSRTLTVQFCYLAFVAMVYYFTIYFSVPQFLYKKKYASFITMLCGAVILASLLRAPLAIYLNQHVFLKEQLQPSFRQIFINSFLNIFVWAICLVAATLIVEKIRFQRFLEALEKEKTRNELDFLKAQFNPHFLFNSINSIYGHIEKSNVEARRMLLTFSEMLRYQLYECNADSIPVEKEISYVKNYMALQQTRKEESLSVHLCIGDEVKGFCIAPMLFIAFIENAFKYVSNFDSPQENKVIISLQLKNEELIFDSFNTKEKMNERIIMHHKGIGISNVKRRLELLYPNRHQLTIEDNDKEYRVILKLQLS